MESRQVKNEIEAPVPRRVVGLYSCPDHSSSGNFVDIAACMPVRAPTPVGSGDVEPRAISKMSENVENDGDCFGKIVVGDDGFVLQDVPHLTDYISDLSTHTNPLQHNKSYSSVKQYFVDTDDTITQNVVVQNDGPRGIHFRRAGPRQRVYFKSDEVNACIVTCGGLCPGLNTVIREIVCGLSYMYNVNTIWGIECGYKGFYARNTIPLTSKYVNDIHKRGGTILGTSRGGHDTIKIVDSIQDRKINQVYIIGGDGTQKGASVIFEEIRRRDLKVSIFGIPKTIDNDIPVIDRSFGFDTAVEEAQRAINAAHVEAQSGENGIGVVKLMGRNSGYIAMHATLASRDVDCCLIPESPFYLEGPGGLFEYITKRLRENGHLVIVVAEGAGQELMSEQSINMTDASGNNLLLDVGMWLSQKIKEHFINIRKMVITLKYIDPTYMIRAIPSNASDNVYCTLLAQSAVHGAMAGYTGCIVGPVNGRHAYIPFHRIIDTQNQVVITDRMWAQLLSSTNQPSFLNPVKKDVDEKKTGTLSHQIGGSGDDVKDPALDRLSIIHSGLSEIISQIDELVNKGIEHKLVDKMDSGDTESFIQFLTDTHLSLKSWVPRFQNAFGGKTQSDETSIDNATDAFDEVVSLSPLVSPWWADKCKVEGGKQLFLLTPLPRSKQPPKTVSRLCGPNFLKCSGKKIIHMTPFSIVRPPPLPSARKFPCEGVDVAETVEANATTKTKKIKFRKGTPFVKSDKKSKLSDDLDCDDEFMVDLASRFPKLLENSVVLEKQPLHSKSMHEQGLKLLDLEVDSNSSTTTSEEEEMGSSDWKGKGESTLKRDLWTKFEALSVLPPQMQDDDTIFYKTHL